MLSFIDDLHLCGLGTMEVRVKLGTYLPVLLSRSLARLGKMAIGSGASVLDRSKARM